MREVLSQLLVRSAVEDPDFVVLSGDHGYALFDALRREKPGQFINAGVAEQAMVGTAAGLARVGFKPVVYGLAAFVPIRVLEQIKLDVCFSGLPVIFLGDGAGLVYSTLGASHQAAEDLACLRPLPGIRIFSPCDAEELTACYREARASGGPCYIRVGKSDRASVHDTPLASTAAHFVRRPKDAAHCLVASGAMVDPCARIAAELGLACLSVPRIKPFDDGIFELLRPFRQAIVVEEHSAVGGLASAIMDASLRAEDRAPLPRLRGLALEEKFSKLCGSHQFALSEHALDDVRLKSRVREFVGA
jgi:transketolase